MAIRSVTLAARGTGRRDATQEAILGATRRLLDTGASLASLSVGRIAEEAKVSRATFYLHFPGKQDLISRLAEDQMRQWRLFGSRLLENPDFTREDLEEALAEIIVIWRAEGTVLGALIELAEYDEAAKDAWTGVVGAIGLEAAGVLANRRPELSREQAEALGTAISWTIERTCHEMLGPEPDEKSDVRLKTALTDIIWGASVSSSSE
jgi:AcrR family transcriptional regulator